MTNRYGSGIFDVGSHYAEINLGFSIIRMKFMFGHKRQNIITVMMVLIQY